MSDTLDEIKQKANDAFGNLETLVGELKAAKEAGDPADRINALAEKVDEVANEVAAAKAAQLEAEKASEADARIAAIEQRMAEFAKDVRAPSKAAAILGEQQPAAASTDNFFLMLATAQNPKAPAGVRAAAEKALLDMGSSFMSVEDVAEKIAGNGGSYSKAVLGSTDATGGYLAPRAVVAELNQVAATKNPYRRLLTVVDGIVGPTIDIPHVGLTPTRATVVARGATKSNVDVAFANYTATFYTLAQITDAANQWLRQTRGQGEKLIRQRLGEAIALGESYYILQGSGTSEPKGLLTSIGTSGTFVTSHTYSQSTVAGNMATAIAKASGALANRNRVPDAVVMNAGDFWANLAGGDNTAGFYIAPGGANTVNAVGAFSNGDFAMSIWGLPVLADPNMPTDSMVIGQFKGAELYIGEDVRVDTSSEAGDRWDKNLTGFRVEEEIAFNADPYVAAGLFQRITDATA